MNVRAHPTWVGSTVNVRKSMDVALSMNAQSEISKCSVCILNYLASSATLHLTLQDFSDQYTTL